MLLLEAEIAVSQNQSHSSIHGKSRRTGDMGDQNEVGIRGRRRMNKGGIGGGVGAEGPDN